MAIVQSSQLLFRSRTRAHKTPLGTDLQDVEHPGKVAENGYTIDKDEGPSGAHAIEHKGEDCSSFSVIQRMTASAHQTRNPPQ